MRNTIKNHKDFLMSDANPTARHAFFLIRAKPAKLQNDARFGIITTKKTLKLAVHRNLAKRKLRDWILANEKDMRQDWDYVFIVRRAIIDANREEGRDAMRRALRYIGRENAE